MNEAELRVLDVRLANVEDAIMEMKESQKKIGEALTELVRLASKHEAHRTHIEKGLSALDELEDRVRHVEVEQGKFKQVERGALAVVGTLLATMFAFIWSKVTGGGF